MFQFLIGLPSGTRMVSARCGHLRPLSLCRTLGRAGYQDISALFVYESEEQPKASVQVGYEGCSWAFSISWFVGLRVLRPGRSMRWKRHS